MDFTCVTPHLKATRTPYSLGTTQPMPEPQKKAEIRLWFIAIQKL